MAILTVNYMSMALMRTVTVNVVLPVDKRVPKGQSQPEVKKYKTLYLLHGIHGNYTDWVNNTMVQRWAEAKDLAVVMPSGENMFYLDQEKSHAFYGEFIGKELVEMTRRMFPLSDKKEDTYIGGLSMGGYGALRNGLKYHDTFGAIVALSSGLVFDGIENRTNEGCERFFETRDYAEAVFGDLDKVAESDKNPLWIMKNLQAEGIQIPKIYMACGTEDPLFGLNEKYQRLFKECGADLTYEIGPGRHSWDFWNEYIKKAIDWLPLDENAVAGISSGNVGI